MWEGSSSGTIGAMGRPKDPDYWRRWRAEHPAYREREKARAKARRAKQGRSWSPKERESQRRRRQRQRADHGWVETHHPVMEQAAAITQQHIRPDHRSLILDPMYEDAHSAAVLALISGEDAHAAVLATIREERAWRQKKAPLLDAVLLPSS